MVQRVNPIKDLPLTRLRGAGRSSRHSNPETCHETLTSPTTHSTADRRVWRRRLHIQRYGPDGRWEPWPTPCGRTEFPSWELGEEPPEGAVESYVPGTRICLTFTIPDRSEGQITSFTWDWENQRSAACWDPDILDRLEAEMPYPELWPSLEMFPDAP